MHQLPQKLRARKNCTAQDTLHELCLSWPTLVYAIMEIEIAGPSDEAIAAYFYGIARSAYLAYIASPPGHDLTPETALEKWRINCDKLYKRMHNEILIQYDFADSNELMFELDLSISTEYFTHEFFRMCGVFDHGCTMTPVANRLYPVKPIEEETYLMYFIGLSWWMPGEWQNRDERIINFLKTVRAKLAPNVSNERLLELWYSNTSAERIIDYKLMAIDILDCRRCMKRSENQ